MTPNPKFPQKPPKNIWGLFLLLLKNNSGYSVKSMVMLGGFILSAAWSILLMYLVLDYYWKYGEIDWAAIATSLPALATVAGTLIYGKVASEKYERSRNNLFPTNGPEDEGGQD